MGIGRSLLSGRQTLSRVCFPVQAFLMLLYSDF